MAQDISERIMETYRFPRMPQIHLKVRTSPLRAKWREMLRENLTSPVATDRNVNAAVTDNFEASKEQFRKNHWAFVENFWDAEFHRKLLEHWPRTRYLNPIRQVLKSYDTGFGWNEEPNDPAYLAQFPAYKAAYDLLRSEAFCQRVTDVAGDGVKRVCCGLLLTRSYWGTSVVPHIDSNNKSGTMNLVMFMDGTGGMHGGGLGIFGDNEYKQPIFVPDNLKNSCLFYDMAETFYHGFPPMRFGSFRWTLNAIFRAA